MLEERPGVAVDCSRGGLAVGGEALGELRPAALEKREAGGGVEVTAERELQREGAVVVARLVGEQLGEQGAAAIGDRVGLAGAARRARAPALPGGGEVARERAGGDEARARGPAPASSSTSSIAPARSRRRSAG